MTPKNGRAEINLPLPKDMRYVLNTILTENKQNVL